MLDIREKALELVEALRAAVPFPAELTPDAMATLRDKESESAVEPKQIVYDVSYAGDDGGILCSLGAKGEGNALVVSLTHLQVYRNRPYTKAVLDYQKHRTKKLRKKFGA